MPKRTPPKKRQSDFRLPPAVSMQKEPLPSGWAYVVRHAKLGLLGRVVYLHPADKYHRLTHRLSQEQKGLDERALMASQRPSHPW
jgi:hypothetical protein